MTPPAQGWSRSLLMMLGPLLGLLLGVGWLALSLQNPPHLDEESYLFIGHAIRDHLLRPYDWNRPWPPDFLPASQTYLYAHPPLFLWWTALTETLAGDSLPLRRLLALPFVLLLVLAVRGIAVHTVAQPERATLAWVISPVCAAVMSQSLMIDLPCVALAAAGLWQGLEGTQRHRTWQVFLGGCLLGLASLTKYPVLALAPVGLFFPLSSARASHSAAPLSAAPTSAAPSRLWLAWGGGILLLFLPWQLLSWLEYGSPHLWHVLSHATEIDRSPLQSRAIGALAHLGLTTLGLTPLLLLACAFRSKLMARRLGPAAVCLSLPALLIVWAVDESHTAARWIPGLTTLADDLAGHVPTSPLNLALLSLSLILGGCALSLLLPTSRVRARDDRWLRVWALLALLAVVLGHNFSGARYFVVASIPLQLLLWRWLELQETSRTGLRVAWAPWAVIGMSFVLSVGLMRADSALAQGHVRLAEAAEEVLAQLKGSSPLPSSPPLYFTGEWGLRREFEARGYAYLVPQLKLEPGMLLLLPRMAAPGPVPDPSTYTVLKTLYLQGDRVLLEREQSFLSLQVHSPEDGISFYSEVLGMLPFGLGRGPQEVLIIAEVNAQ